MTDKLYSAVASAVVKLLRPVVSVLLMNNISFVTFSNLAKWVYVDVASREFMIPGKKKSTSHVSIITGLSRKEVKRVKEIAKLDDIGVVERQNRAVRVISGWLKDPQFLDDRGNPKELPFDEGKISFSSLVRAYSGDVPPGAMLDEMLRLEVAEVKNKNIQLLSRGYIIKEGDVEKLSMLGADVIELISTIEHNLSFDPSEAFLQRKTVYDNIPEEAIPELRALVSEMGAECLESVDSLISKYDRDFNPFIKGKGRKKAGLGIFYIE